jgi:hypothetical protein
MYHYSNWLSSLIRLRICFSPQSPTIAGWPAHSAHLAWSPSSPASAPFSIWTVSWSGNRRRRRSRRMNRWKPRRNRGSNQPRIVHRFLSIPSHEHHARALSATPTACSLQACYHHHIHCSIIVQEFPLKKIKQLLRDFRTCFRCWTIRLAADLEQQRCSRATPLLRHGGRIATPVNRCAHRSRCCFRRRCELWRDDPRSMNSNPAVLVSLRRHGRVFVFLGVVHGEEGVREGQVGHVAGANVLLHLNSARRET